jgi:hypothetical protein
MMFMLTGTLAKMELMLNRTIVQRQMAIHTITMGAETKHFFVMPALLFLPFSKAEEHGRGYDAKGKGISTRASIY